MKHYFTVIALSFMSLLAVQAQSYREGFILKKDGQKMECLLSQDNWHFKSGVIKYKTSIETSTKLMNISNIKEFGYKDEKYGVVESDNSLGLTEAFFLKVDETHYLCILQYLVQGNYSLFRSTGDSAYYLFQAADVPIQLLDTKTYKEQIIKQLDSQSLKQARKAINNSLYSLSSLSNIFSKINGSSAKTYTGGRTSQYYLTIKPGMNINNYKTGYYYMKYNELTKAETRIGLEGELLLPTDKQRASLLLEAVYRKNNFSQEMIPEDGRNIPFGNQILTIDYQALQLNFGVRYRYLKINGAKFYLTLQAAVSRVINNNIQFGVFSATSENTLRLGHYLATGVSLFDERVHAEFIYGHPRFITTTSVRAPIQLSFIGFNVGYTFFKTDR